MKTILQIASRLFDMVAGLALVGATLSLIYAINLTEIVHSGLYFDRFFSLFAGAVVLFMISRAVQLSLELSSQWSSGIPARREQAALYETASTAR